METIIAQGNAIGSEITITVTGVSGKYDIDIQPKNLEKIVMEMLDEELDKPYQVAPLYYPERDSIHKIDYVLRKTFFDEKPNIVHKGEIEPYPFNKDVIY